MIRALVRSIAAIGMLATPAFSHDGCELPVPRYAAPLPWVRIGLPIGAIEFGVVRPVHRHVFRVETERIWVEPRFETRMVGRDLCGRPLWRRVVVRAGYWSVRSYEVCRCGANYCR